MAPKGGITQSQKLEKCLQYFHESRTCHTLKDLETAIPTATKVNKMQVKDLLKELTDTNQVKVEKIGSGNWYWAWAGEEAGERQQNITRLESEAATLQSSVIEMQGHIDKLQSDQAESRNFPEFQQLVDKVPQLEQAVLSLVTKKDELETAIVGGFEGKQKEKEELKQAIGQMTDNICALEDWLGKQFQGDRSMVESVKLLCYGDEYVEGEELVDVDLV